MQRIDFETYVQSYKRMGPETWKQNSDIGAAARELLDQLKFVDDLSAILATEKDSLYLEASGVLQYCSYLVEQNAALLALAADAKHRAGDVLPVVEHTPSAATFNIKDKADIAKGDMN